MIDFDDIWQKYSKHFRTEFVCFSFHVGLLFINFLSVKPDTENCANFENYRRHIACQHGAVQ